MDLDEIKFAIWLHAAAAGGIAICLLPTMLLACTGAPLWRTVLGAVFSLPLSVIWSAFCVKKGMKK